MAARQQRKVRIGAALALVAHVFWHHKLNVLLTAIAYVLLQGLVSRVIGVGARLLGMPLALRLVVTLFFALLLAVLLAGPLMRRAWHAPRAVEDVWSGWAPGLALATTKLALFCLLALTPFAIIIFAANVLTALARRGSDTSYLDTWVSVAFAILAVGLLPAVRLLPVLAAPIAGRRPGLWQVWRDTRGNLFRLCVLFAATGSAFACLLLLKALRPILLLATSLPEPVLDFAFALSVIPVALAAVAVERQLHPPTSPQANSSST